MTSANAVRITPRLIFGIGILVLGLLWTLDNLNVIESESITQWWPILLVAAGVVRLMDRGRGKVGSVVLIVIGSFLLLDNLRLIHFDLDDLFPLLIAAIGAKLVWDAFDRRSPRGDGITNDPSANVSAFAFMAGVRRQSNAMAFQGGDANAIMGGVVLDLRNAQIPDGQEAVIDTFAWWGGIEIIVPPNWRVVGKVLPLMGGFEDKTVAATTPGGTLVVRGLAVMGAVEVKNVSNASRPV
jgi:predicted membrane protein